MDKRTSKKVDTVHSGVTNKYTIFYYFIHIVNNCMPMEENVLE